ncbi:MAG: hypothetical protein IJ343_05285 [Clostridia bacterium]|nr:hypothetical protein [Clostridia bacterium]
MKFFAILSVLVLILTLVSVGSLYMTANIYVEACGVVTVEAPARQDMFDTLSEQVRLGAVVGTPYATVSSLGSADGYQFCIYTVRLRNNCRIPAEMVELQVSPMAGDVLQVGDAPYVSVTPGGTSDATAVILTTAGNHSIREVSVTYYMWGMPFTLKTTVK